MKQFFVILFLFVSKLNFAQYKVILDADIDSDADDVEALAMLHSLADDKEIDFIGVVVTSDDPYAPTCAAAINNYFGRSNLPIGFLKNQLYLKNHSRYTRQVSEEFPGELKSYKDAEDAVRVYRKLLSESPDSSVVIITIGHLSSLSALFKSGSDEFSSLNGLELAEKKIVKWICMGGHFPQGKEANFYRPDPASTLYTLSVWSKPVIFAGWEVGEQIKTGGEYLKDGLPVKNPVYRAYEFYNGFSGRSSWDQVAVFLLRPDADKYFYSETNGYCKVFNDGSNLWIINKESKHEYVKFREGANFEEIARLMDNMAIRRSK